MTDKVSIIILTKNEEDTIGKCLEYILNQTYSNLEIIVVDANSIDSTVDIARKYGAKVVKERKKGGGFGYARNLGVKVAKGNFILFLSADVYLVDPETLEKALNSIFDYNVDGVWGKLIFPKTPLGVYFSRAFEAPLQITDKWNSKPPRTTCFLMLKREVFDEIGYFDENFKEGVEDQEFIFRLYKNGKRLLYNPNIKVLHYTNCSIEYQVRKAYKEGKMLRKLYMKYNIGNDGFDSNLYFFKTFIASIYSCLSCAKICGVRSLSVFIYNYKLMMARRRGFLQGQA